MKTKFFKSATANVVITPVLVPDVEDRNWDVISSFEIQKTAYEFIENLSKKSVNIDHEDWTDIDWVKYVESYIVPVDMNFWEWEIITKGTWVVWIKLTEELYKQALEWEFTSVSMEWWWNSNEI